MSGSLERLVESEVGDCCEADVEEKRGELRRLSEKVDDGFEPGYVRALSALGDGTRYRIVSALAEEGEMCVCEFGEVLDVSESAVSHAFKKLHDAGLVEREKRGKWRYYSATSKAIAVLEAVEDEA